MNDDSRLWREPRHEPNQAFARHRHATRGRPKTRPRHMQEYSAAAACHARPGVVIDFDDQVVETIGPGQTIAWFTGRPPERPVVAPINWVFTPGIERPDPPHRQ